MAMIKIEERTNQLLCQSFHCSGAIGGVEACDDPTQMHQCYSNGGGECAKVENLMWQKRVPTLDMKHLGMMDSSKGVY